VAVAVGLVRELAAEVVRWALKSSTFSEPVKPSVNSSSLSTDTSVRRLLSSCHDPLSFYRSHPSTMILKRTILWFDPAHTENLGFLLDRTVSPRRAGLR